MTYSTSECALIDWLIVSVFQLLLLLIAPVHN